MLLFLCIFSLLIYPSLQIQYRSPPPFYHNPRIPPTLYISNMDTYLTLPDISYYPPPPVNPPGFTSYGDIAYQDKTRLQNNKVKTALAWKDLLRNQHHHEMHNIEMTNITDRNIHDVYRERYSAKLIPSQASLDGFESYNILEMTNYITMDDRGLIYSSEGNASCISIYNTKALTEWHQKHVDTFKKQFPNSTFPLYTLGNYTTDEKFKIEPGRIIHREPVTITCCGSQRKRINIRYHINGRHPCVNCHTQMGYIPLRKLMFRRIEEEKPTTTESGEWYEIDVYSIEENTTTKEENIDIEDKKNNAENATIRNEDNSTNIENITVKYEEINTTIRDLEEIDKNITDYGINNEETNSTNVENIENDVQNEEIKEAKTEDVKEEEQLIEIMIPLESTTDNNPPYEIYIRGQKVLVRNRVNTNG